MLLAYIDETGETGAFVSKDDKRFNTSPAFGYAGFIIPSQHAREFGAVFQAQKNTLFQSEIRAASKPGQWERKGADIFRPDTPEKHPEQLRVFDHLVRRMQRFGGRLFYYADEKPQGTPGQTKLDTAVRETAAMQETLNRIARHANDLEKNVMVMMDQITEKTRAERLPNMYGHILGRAVEFPEMRSIIEPPMHVDSQLSSNIQFADWVAAAVARAIDYQLIASSRYTWVTDKNKLKSPHGAFTHESKLHLWHRDVGDFHHSEIFKKKRPLHPEVSGHRPGSTIDPDIVRKIRGKAERSHGAL